MLIGAAFSVSLVLTTEVSVVGGNGGDSPPGMVSWWLYSCFWFVPMALKLTVDFKKNTDCL